MINEPVAQRIIFAGRGLGCWVRTGPDNAVRPVLRCETELRRARVQVVNPSTWHGDLLMTLHRSVVITGHLGGEAGVLTG